MNTTLYRSITHPPDNEEHEDEKVLQLPAPDELRALPFADRLTFRIGLWLLRRSQRPSRRSAATAEHWMRHDRNTGHTESMSLLSYDIQRQWR